MTINDTQRNCIHLQIENITRHFSNHFINELAVGKIYKLIRSYTKARKLEDLDIPQYNTIMHHLYRLEHAASLHYRAVIVLEKTLLQNMLECEIIPNTKEYHRPEYSPDELENHYQKAKAALNFTQLFEI